MRILNREVASGSALVADVNYTIQQLEHIYGYSVQVIWVSTTAAATIKLQGSNIDVKDTDYNAETSWTDVATQTIANDSSSVLFNQPNAMYKFFRIKLDWTSGSVTTLKARAQIKGW